MAACAVARLRPTGQRVSSQSTHRPAHRQQQQQQQHHTRRPHTPPHRTIRSPASPSPSLRCPSACVVSYCADDWLLKFYFAAREVTNSISGLRPVTLEVEKKTAEAAEAVQRLADKQKKIQQKTEERSGGSSGSEADGAGGSGEDGTSAEDDDRVVEESEGAGQIPLHSSPSQSQQPVQQKQRGGDADGYGIENWDLTGVVDGHTDYPRKMHEILDTVHFRP
jgi:hypothetical protein